MRRRWIALALALLALALLAGMAQAQTETDGQTTQEESAAQALDVAGLLSACQDRQLSTRTQLVDVLHEYVLGQMNISIKELAVENASNAREDLEAQYLMGTVESADLEAAEKAVSAAQAEADKAQLEQMKLVSRVRGFTGQDITGCSADAQDFFLTLQPSQLSLDLLKSALTSSGEAENLFLTDDGAYILAGSSLPLELAATDNTMRTVRLSGQVRATASRGSIASGVRRIEATVGQLSLDTMNRNQELLFHAAQVFKTTPGELAARAEQQMAEMTPVTYTSRDGLEIEGYLTLPVGKTLHNAKNLPVVVNPHGGPWARDSWGFNPEVQFLANRGYAVLQMNFRGSTGFGRKFTEIAYGKWGQTMQDDITDGVNWLIEKGIADPAKIAIYGGSYGGYATLQGIVKDPDLYACAVDYVGVSNLFSFLQTIPPYWKPMLDMMYEMVGNPEKDAQMLRENSPALNAERIKTPLLVVQGANDPRVNINESNQMVNALRKRGVHVDYMVKDNEGHGFHNEENRFDFYRTMEKFLGKYLKGIEPEGEIVPEDSRR